MNIHNKLEIYFKGKKYESYNNMLSPIFEKIKRFYSYNNILVVGNGNSKTTVDTETLDNATHSYNLTTESMNTNILSGPLFVKKSLVLGSDNNDELVIKELGIGLTAISSSTPNPKVVNRFVLVSSDEDGEGLVRHAGEYLKIVITLYLKFDKENSDFNLLVSDTNHLVSYLLGEKTTGSSSLSINFAKSSDYSIPTSADIVGSYEGMVTSGSITFEQIDKTHGRVRLVSNTSYGSAVEVMIANGKVLMARRNFFDNAVWKSGSVVKSSNKFGRIYMHDKEFLKIDGVKNLANNAIDMTYSVEKDSLIQRMAKSNCFGTTYKYLNTVKNVVSKDTKKIAFFTDNGLDIWDVTATAFLKLNSNEIVETNIQKVIMFDKYLFVLGIYNSEQTIGAYELVENSYVRRTFTFENISNFSVLDFDIVQMRNNMFKLGLVRNDGTGSALINFYGLLDDGNFSESVVLDIPSTSISSVYGVVSNSVSDANLVFVSSSANGTGVKTLYTNNLGSIINTFTGQNIDEIVDHLTTNVVDGYPLVGARGIVVLNTDATTKAFIVDTNEETPTLRTIEAMSNYTITKISTDGKYIMQKRNYIYHMAFIDDEFSKIEFFTNLKNIIVANIKRIEFVDAGVLCFLSTSTAPNSLAVYKKAYTSISGLDPNTEYEIMYTDTDAVGDHGEDVRVVLNIDISLN